MTRQLATAFLVGALALILSTNAYAGTITAVSSVAGGGNAVVDPILTMDENNDNFSFPSPVSNILVASKLFNANEPIDIVFEVDDSDGVTEYLLAEGVANVSGVDFLMYEFQIGFGTGDNFALASAGNGLDFDWPNVDPGASASNYFTTAPMEKRVRFSMGPGILDGMTGSFTVSIDVPDFDAASMPASAETAGGYRFTLRQVPSVIPEPGTIGIAILSALACTVYTLRRKWG